MADYIEREALLAAYDAVHEGPPGEARKLIANAPAVDVVPYTSWFASAKQGSGVSKGQLKCTECAHYKECRSKRDLRRKYAKCPLASGERFVTNADRVRMMSDEELAEFITNKVVSEAVQILGSDGNTHIRREAVRNRLMGVWVYWLKQPYKEGS